MENKKGLFIAIEGGDGLGKTTLINNLKKEYQEAVFTHEPGGNEFCESVRNMIMSNTGLTKQTEMYLFCASRAEFVDKVVLPNINAGKMVITDRYIYSSLVYQGVLGGLGVDNVLQTNQMAVKNVMPDIVIYLKGRKSFRQGKENRFDEQTSEEAKAIYEGFDLISNRFSNFVTIDVTNLNEEQVFKIAVKEINDRIKRNNEIEK